jgi:hypothetical protein
MHVVDPEIVGLFVAHGANDFKRVLLGFGLRELAFELETMLFDADRIGDTEEISGAILALGHEAGALTL